MWAKHTVSLIPKQHLFLDKVEDYLSIHCLFGWIFFFLCFFFVCLFLVLMILGLGPKVTPVEEISVCILHLLNPLAYSHKTCYRTCMTEEPFFGDEECTACVTDVDNELIEVVAPQDSELQNAFTVRIILSPSFPNEFYPDSILCRYFTTTVVVLFEWILPRNYLCQYFTNKNKSHVSFFRICLL